MSKEIRLVWDHSVQIDQLQLHLYDKKIISSLSPQIIQNSATFNLQQAHTYLLDWQYIFQGSSYYSYSFLLDYPDITYLNLKIEKQGARFDELGFFDEQGKFIDMLIYEGSKPHLTFPFNPQHLKLTQWFLKDLKHDSQQQKQTLNELLPDLSQAFPILSRLWSYQLRLLLHPVFLARTTPEWKACLLQALRNHLILLDDERLFVVIQDAIKYAQEHQRVNELLSLMDWDSDKQDWVDEATFIRELQGKRILKSS